LQYILVDRLTGECVNEKETAQRQRKGTSSLGQKKFGKVQTTVEQRKLKK
jgi:hypothetical protein